MSEPSPSTEIFDRIGALQADAAVELGFDRDARCAATSPGPAFPTVLRTLADAVLRRTEAASAAAADVRADVAGAGGGGSRTRTPESAGPATIVDLGAGLGGASTWLADETGARVIAIEPASGAREAARTLFPHLDVRAGSAEHSGLPGGIADAVVLLGVISLVEELTALLDEVRRLLRPDGVLGVADMFLTGDGTGHSGIEHSGVNTLRTVAATAAELASAGFEVTTIGCANDAAPDEAWRRRADELRWWLVEHHRDDPAVVAWLADQEQLAAWIGGEHVFGACIVARPVLSTSYATDGPLQ